MIAARFLVFGITLICLSVSVSVADLPDTQKAAAKSAEPVSKNSTTSFEHSNTAASEIVNFTIKEKVSDATADDIKHRINNLDLRLRLIEDLTFFDKGKSLPNIPIPFSFFKTKEWENEIDSLTKNLSIGDKNTNLPHFTRVESDGMALYHSEGNPVINDILKRGMSNYDLQNGVQNTITVTAPGLVNVGEIRIYADASQDEILLDGCLRWKKTGQDKIFDVWTAKDSKNIKKTIRFSKDVPTHILPACDNRYKYKELIKEFRNYFTTPPKLDHGASLMAQMPLETEKSMEAPKDLFGTDIAKYSDQTSKYPQYMFALDTIISLMKNHAIPPKTPTWISGARYPDIFTLQDWDLESISKSEGNLFTLTSGDNPQFSMGRTGKIIFLRKGWRNQSIDMNCVLSDMQSVLFAESGKITNKKGGLGITFSRDEALNVVVDVQDQEGGAAKVGIKTGDTILRIEDKIVTSMDTAEILSKLRGPIGTNVTLTLLPKSGKTTQKKRIARQALGPEKIHGLKIIDFKWPYRYSNFIVFDKDVDKANLRFEDEGKVILDTQTGGKIKLKHGGCYNPVYAKDFDRP